MNCEFDNTVLWPDNNGVHINAHGAGVLFHAGTYYWYGEHKLAGEAGNRAHIGVHVYSSTDLCHWQDRGIALRVSEDPTSPIAKGCILERPKVIYNKMTKKFIMWFHLELADDEYKSAMAGTAVSDSPIGPFQFLKASRLNVRRWPLNFVKEDRKKPGNALLIKDFETGQMSRDMTLFVDNDQTAYLFASSEDNHTCHISRLTPDYLDTTGEYVRAFVNRHMEAHAVCKRDGWYYYLASGCTGWAPNQARAAVAANIFGPWQELRNPCIGMNSQNGSGPELTFGGQSTFILHVHETDQYIAMFDIWNPQDAIDGRYLWLPVTFHEHGYDIEFKEHWTLDSQNM